MGVKNKIFIENQTGNKVKIADVYGDIAMTDSKSKISVARLLDSNYYTEEIDPNNFFNEASTYNLFAEKIKSVDTSKLPDDGEVDINIEYPEGYKPATNESAVYTSTMEDEEAELRAKYKIPAPVENSLDKVLENMDQPNRPVVQPNPQNTRPSDHARPLDTPVVPRPEDPMVVMFRNTKRSIDFSINLNINNKIPRLDFIEMMEESYERSIIEFLADEFTNNILNNPGNIRSMIIKELENKVYPNGKPCPNCGESPCKCVIEEEVKARCKNCDGMEDEWSEERDQLIPCHVCNKEKYDELMATTKEKEVSSDISKEVEDLVKEAKKEEKVKSKKTKTKVVKEEVEKVVNEKPEPPEPPKDRVIVEGENPPKPKSMK